MRLVAAILFVAGALLVAWFVITLGVNDELTSLGLLKLIPVVMILVGLLLLAAFLRYKRPRADQAMVRTGGRKYKVKFEGGGLWLFTIIHEVQPVSLNTMRLDIQRQGADESLITGDFMRADVEAVFYVKVKPDEENVIKAAQTLGERTIPVQELRRALSIGRRRAAPLRTGGKEAEKDLMLENIKSLLDDKVDGALRAVAATMDLEELQKERQKFADAVRDAVEKDLLENGLALETVTITMLNQTPVEEMDPQNRFDAIGIKEITGITKVAFKEKEQIVKDTEVAVTKIEVDAAKSIYELEKDKAWAQADKEMKVATFAAEKEAETVKVSYEQELISTKAGILKDQELQKAEIQKIQEVEIAQVEQEQKVAERGIEKNLIVETKTIEQGQKVAEREIQMKLEVEMKRIDQEEKIQVRDYEKELAIEKANIAQQEGVALRDVEKILAITMATIQQEQQVMEREIEKNKFVEVANIEMGQKVQEREIERNLIVQQVTFDAQVGIKDAEVDSLKKQYVFEKDRALVDADQKKIIQAYSAERKAEGTKVQYEQEAVERKAMIAKDQTIMEREIEKNQYVEVANIEMGQKIQEREIERNLIVQQVTFDAQVGIKDAEVGSLKKQYILEKDRAVVDADQKKIIQAYSATRKAEGTKVQYEQEAVEREAMIAKDQTIMEREIEKNRYVEVANIEMGQKIQEREIERNLIVQQVTFDAQVGIKDAEVTSLKKQYVFEKDRAVVDADQKKIIQAYSATRKAEGTKVQYEQEAVEREAMIAKDQTIMEREIEKNRYVEVANIEMGQKIQEREIERNLIVQQVTFDAQIGIKDAEVDSLKKQYVMEKDRAVVDADQKKIIQAYSAARKAEGTKVQYEQEAVERKAMIAKDQVIMEREIDKNKVVEVAQIDMGKVIQVKEIDRNLQVQKATFEAQVGIKRADTDSQIKQFSLEQDRSWAEADQRKQIAAYVAARQAEAAQIQYEQDVIKEVARISREQVVMEREIDKNLVIEKAQIEMGKQVMQTEINQQLVVGLAEEDRKITLEYKMKDTDLSMKTHLEATALKNVADVHAITVERVGEADRDKQVAIINAEREAKPMERLADAILAQAKAKAEGEKKMIEAKNVTEQRVLVQQAILSLIETAPQLVERLMKPVEKIESIRILDMGGRGAGGGLDKSAMGRIASNLMDTGSVMPMVKEFLKFADVDADELARKASEYLSGLVKIQPKK